MASADCECCGQPTTVPGNGLVAVQRECDHDCLDCPSCNACGYGDCSGVEHVPARVLCDDCAEDGEGCVPGAWHCTCGRACDGSACPGPDRAPGMSSFNLYDDSEVR